MKRFSYFILILIGGLFLSVNTKAQTSNINPEGVKNLKPYPLTVDTLKRHVIFLEEKEDESLYKIELIAGKTMQGDCNHMWLMGIFEEETIEGWGYSFYKFKTNGHVASTLMGCPDNKLNERFVSGENKLIRYNSRLPVVVYLPEGYQLKYRIWTAGELQTVTDERIH